jgi:hypothetical protein
MFIQPGGQMLASDPIDELPDSDGAQLATVDAVVVDWLKGGVITMRPDDGSETLTDVLAEERDPR